MAANPLLLMSCLVLTSCVRLGFHESPDGALDASVPPEAGHGDLPHDVGADSRIPTKNETCVPGGVPCAAGLVCTGAGTTYFCRPTCAFDAGSCPDGQACGRPLIAGVTDPTAPRACITSGTADRYQSCVELPCKKGLGCLKGDPGLAFCFSLCANDSNCEPQQLCLTPPGVSLGICLPTCATKADCPAPQLQCVGIGPYPKNLCGPVASPLALGAACATEQACGPNMRCVGPALGLRACYRICPTSASCQPAEECVATEPLAPTVAFCLRRCGLFDKPVVCAPHEFCIANATLGKTICAPGAGVQSDCSSAPCVSGKLCVDKVCRVACDDQHVCATGVCTGTTFNGQPTPWKVCK